MSATARDVIEEYIRVWAPMSNPAHAADILAALDAAGFAIVPKEPTETMLTNSWKMVKDQHSGFVGVAVLTTLYKAMLAASTEPPKETPND